MKKSDKTYIVVEQFLDDRTLNIYSFTTREKAIAYSQERIDYMLDLDTSHNDFSLSYCQWNLYIPWVVYIFVMEQILDIMETNKKPCLTPNCLAKKDFYILTN